jgi:hypothetical protein
MGNPLLNSGNKIIPKAPIQEKAAIVNFGPSNQDTLPKGPSNTRNEMTQTIQSQTLAHLQKQHKLSELKL